MPRLPAKGLSAGLFFIAFPVVAFFLLHGGGLGGFGVSWTADFLSGLADSIGDAGRKLTSLGEATAVVGLLLAWLGRLVVLLSVAVSYLIWPLTWLRDQIQAADRPVWADFAATAAIVSILLFVLSGGIRPGWRSLILSLAVFAGLGVVILIMGLGHRRLPIFDTRLWGRPLGTPRVRGRERAGTVLVEDHRADRDAASLAACHSRPRQQFHRAVQGHFAGLDRGAVRFAREFTGFVFRSGLGDSDHVVYRLCLHRNDLLRLLFWNVALLPVRREQAERTSA